MTPYTKEIVELHKIHKAIENRKGSGGGDGGGGGDTSEDAFLIQVLTILNNTENFYFDENTTQSCVFPISDWDNSWAEGCTLLGNKETADYVIGCYDGNNDIPYYIFVTTDELSTLEKLYYPYKNYYNDWNTPYISTLIDSESFNKPGCLFDNQEFAQCTLFGIEHDSILGPEFDGGINYEVAEPKFSFRPGSEGEYDGFVYMNHNLIKRLYTQEQQNDIYNFLESLYQRAYLASSTQDYDIYIIQIYIHIGNLNTYLYTPYVVKKQI